MRMHAVSDPQTPASSNLLSRQPPAFPNQLLLRAESQWLFTESELLRTPSALDGLAPEKERDNRGKGVNFILQVGIMLQLPQITLATASVFLHRFFMRHSMVDVPGRPGLHYYAIAATSLFLASKVEENCRKMKELVVACVRVAQKNPNKVVDEQDKEYWRWKDTILQYEDLLLEANCFDLSLEPPYKTLFEFLLFFGEENHKRLRNAAWAFVNDSCLTMLCLLFPSRTIAASALYAAAKHCGVSFADDQHGRPWWEAVGVELKNIRRAINYMADIYENSPLRGGVEGNIYERTPEDGDEMVAKTRATRSKDEGTPVDAGLLDQVTARSVRSDTGNEIGHGKREREEDDEGAKHRPVGNGTAGTNGCGNGHAEDDDIPWGGETAEERESKRRKVEGKTGDATNEDRQHSDDASPTQPPTDCNGLVSPNVDDVSEEGEVEP
ncbi:Cyclin-like [Lasallia pustulata]|uniref:RNA polymerase II holoenzyme cyclin-like subunit n=1 Tax=Lasallia pustulata TaxID=136370 RepID=A0A1W5D4V4_9LECA|nr:Cyclin-like [Lasallia pustulata]